MSGGAGYIKLYRGWRNDPVFNCNGPFSEAEAWLWLIENATWKDTVRRTGQGSTVTLERGQLHVSLGSLAAAWNWSIKRVRGFLDRLENSQMIAKNGAHTGAQKGHSQGTVKGKNGTVLTISNYRKYQDQDGPQGTVEGTKKGTVRAQSGHTQEEGKEGKEEKKSSKADLPEWLPADEWAGFVEMRKAIKKPLTQRAMELAIGKLDGFRKGGHSLSVILQQSTLNCWQDLYPPKAEAKQEVKVGI